MKFLSHIAVALLARIALLTIAFFALSGSASAMLSDGTHASCVVRETGLDDRFERVPTHAEHLDEAAIATEDVDPETDSDGQPDGLGHAPIEFAYGVLEAQEAPATVTRCVAGAHTERLKSEHVEGAFSARGPPASRA